MLRVIFCFAMYAMSVYQKVNQSLGVLPARIPCPAEWLVVWTSPSPCRTVVGWWFHQDRLNHLARYILPAMCKKTTFDKHRENRFTGDFGVHPIRFLWKKNGPRVPTCSKIFSGCRSGYHCLLLVQQSALRRTRASLSGDCNSCPIDRPVLPGASTHTSRCGTVTVLDPLNVKDEGELRHDVQKRPADLIESFGVSSHKSFRQVATKGPTLHRSSQDAKIEDLQNWPFTQSVHTLLSPSRQLLPICKLWRQKLR